MSRHNKRIYVFPILISFLTLFIINDIFPVNTNKGIKLDLNTPPIEYIGTHGEILTDTYKNVSIVESPGSADYVIVDYSYTFPEISNYTKIGSYIDRVVMTSQYDINNISFSNTLEKFNYNLKNYSDYGVFHTSLSEVKYGVPEYHKLFNGYMKNRFYTKVNSESAAYMYCGGSFFKKNLLDDGFNIMLKTSVPKYENEKIIAQDEMTYQDSEFYYDVGAIFDLYVKNDATSKSPLVLPGLELLEDYEVNYCINILTHSSDGVNEGACFLGIILKLILYGLAIIFFISSEEYLFYED